MVSWFLAREIEFERRLARPFDATTPLTRTDGPLHIVHPSLITVLVSLSSPQSTMSTAPFTSTSPSNFGSIFNAALESYNRKTKKDLVSHPLLPSLQSCDSPNAVLTVLREQVPAFNQSQNCDDGLTKWVAPTVNVLYPFSETISQGVGLVSIKVFRHEEFLL